MQLRINITNNNIFENIEDLLFADDRSVAWRFMKNLPWEVYENLSPQYELQVISSIQIKKLLWSNAFKNIKGFYFGTEQCEFLMPTLEETKKAIQFTKDFDKKYTSKDIKRFVFLTPYFGNMQMRDRLQENLQYLNDNAHFINPKTINGELNKDGKSVVEVVINDYGVLHMVKHFPNLVPVLGRILVKTLKNPIVDTLWLEKNVHIPWELMKNKLPEEINEIKHKIAENQKRWMWRSALNNDYFLKFLNRKLIDRAWIDYLQEFSTLYDTTVNIDIYYPYALIFIGRLCDVSAVQNIKRGYYPIDEICPRTCWKYEINIQNFDTVWYKVIQKWNAGYKSQAELNLPAQTIEKYGNRLIYTPLM